MLPRSRTWLGCAVAFVLFAGPAYAQLDESVASVRRALIAEAQRASRANDHRRALDLAERAGRLRMSGSLRRFLAEEHEAIGDAVRALASARLCIEALERETDVRDRSRHMAACREIERRAIARVGSLIVRPASDAPSDMRVTVAGEDVPPALWGVPLPVRPGDLEVVTDAPTTARASMHSTVHIEPGATQSIEVTLAPIASPAPAASPAPEASTTPGSDAPSSGVPSTVSASASPSPSPTTAPGHASLSPAFESLPADARPMHRSTIDRVAPWSLGGAGSAAFTATVAFAIVRFVALAQYTAMCPADVALPCPPTARAPYDTAVLFNDATNATLVIGAVLSSAGALWLGMQALGRNRSAHAGGSAREPLAPVAH